VLPPRNVIFLSAIDEKISDFDLSDSFPIPSALQCDQFNNCDDSRFRVYERRKEYYIDIYFNESIILCSYLFERVLMRQWLARYYIIGALSLYCTLSITWNKLIVIYPLDCFLLTFLLFSLFRSFVRSLIHSFVFAIY
jgi:hypothetical protein